MLLLLVMTVLATVMEFCCCAKITYLWILLPVRCTYYMSGISEIIGVHYRGTLILCIYKQPSISDATLVGLLTRFRAANSLLPIIIFGFLMSMNMSGWAILLLLPLVLLFMGFVNYMDSLNWLIKALIRMQS